MPQVEDWTRYYRHEATTRRFVPEEDPAEEERAAFAGQLLPAGSLGRTLDVGAGDGWLAAMLNRRPATAVTVLDLVPQRAERAARRVGGAGAAARAEQLPFAEGAFDTVVMIEVLEHVSDVAAVLAEVRRVALGGRLLITVPHEQKIPWVTCPCCLKEFPVDGHLHSFSAQSLRAMLEECGLSPREVTVYRRDIDRRWQQIPPFRWLGQRAGRAIKHRLEKWRIVDAPPGRFIGAMVDPVQ